MRGIVAAKGNGKPSKIVYATATPIEEVTNSCGQYTGFRKILCETFEDWELTCTTPQVSQAFVLNRNACMKNSYYDLDTSQYVTFEPAAGDNWLGVNLDATRSISERDTSTATDFLPAPFGGLITNIEFIYSSPPFNNCEQNPDGPSDCAKCPSGYCCPFGLSCPPGYFPLKIGPCIKTRDGGSIQGWQCLPTTYDVYQGTCQSCDLNIYGLGQYTNLDACQSAITTPQCSGNGTCVQGDCNCRSGYAGPTCSAACTRANGCGVSPQLPCTWATQEAKQYCGSPSDTYCCSTQYGVACCR